MLAHLGVRAEELGLFWREYVPRLPRAVVEWLVHETVPFAFVTDENMTGHYEVNLARPLHRSFLAALIESNERLLLAAQVRTHLRSTRVLEYSIVPTPPRRPLPRAQRVRLALSGKPRSPPVRDPDSILTCRLGSVRQTGTHTARQCAAD